MIPCQICVEKPNSHSFSIYDETSDHAWFYSSDHYLDRNTDNVVSHIRGELDSFHKTYPTRKWSWLFDSHQYEFRFESISMILDVMKVIQTYKDTFICIRIIRTNPFIHKTIELCKSFLTDEMMSKIKMDDIEETK